MAPAEAGAVGAEHAVGDEPGQVAVRGARRRRVAQRRDVERVGRAVRLAEEARLARVLPRDDGRRVLDEVVDQVVALVRQEARQS